MDTMWLIKKKQYRLQTAVEGLSIETKTRSLKSFTSSLSYIVPPTIGCFLFSLYPFCVLMKIISIKEILKDTYTIDMSSEGMSGEAKSKNRAAYQKKKKQKI